MKDLNCGSNSHQQQDVWWFVEALTPSAAPLCGERRKMTWDSFHKPPDSTINDRPLRTSLSYETKRVWLKAEGGQNKKE